MYHYIIRKQWHANTSIKNRCLLVCEIEAGLPFVDDQLDRYVGKSINGSFVVLELGWRVAVPGVVGIPGAVGLGLGTSEGLAADSGDFDGCFVGSLVGS